MIRIKIATPQNAAKIRKNLVPLGSSLHSFPVYFLTRSHPSFVVTIAAYMIAEINVFMCFVLKVKNEANVETSAVLLQIMTTNGCGSRIRTYDDPPRN